MSGAPGTEGYRFGWLLWFAVATVSCLPPVGIPSFITLALAACFVTAWLFLNISPKRLLTAIFYMVLDIFFREISSRNQFKVRRLRIGGSWLLFHSNSGSSLSLNSALSRYLLMVLRVSSFALRTRTNSSTRLWSNTR